MRTNNFKFLYLLLRQPVHFSVLSLLARFADLAYCRPHHSILKPISKLKNGGAASQSTSEKELISLQRTSVLAPSVSFTIIVIIIAWDQGFMAVNRPKSEGVAQGQVCRHKSLATRAVTVILIYLVAA